MKRKRHVLVGAGTSGVILAKYLIDNGHDVLLFEEGLEDDRESAQQTSQSRLTSELFNLHSLDETWTYQCYSPNHANFIKSVAQDQLGGRQILYPRGKGLGGTSNINAMIFYRGHNEVFDQLWPQLWSGSFLSKLEVEVLRMIDFGEAETSGEMEELIASASLLRKEDRTEAVGVQEMEGHSNSPTERANFASLSMDYSTYTTRHRSTMDSCRTKRKKLAEIFEEKSSSSTHDNNADQVKGKISIIKAQVLRVNIVNQAAVSVTAKLPCGTVEDFNVNNGGEVVLCAGVFLTAKLLVKSIKEAEPSFAHGSSPLVDFEGEDGKVRLPLNDHAILPCIWWGGWWQGWKQQTVYPVSGVHGWVYLNKEGDLHGSSDATSASLPPQFQLLFLDGSGSLGLGELLLPLFPSPHPSVLISLYNFIRPYVLMLLTCLSRLSLLRCIVGGVFGALLCCVQPRSRGSMTINEDGKVEIDPALLRNEHDMKGLYSSYNTLCSLIAQWHKRRQATQSASWFSYLCNPLLSPLQLLPGPVFGHSDTYQKFQLFARSLASTYFHPCGTLPMRVNAEGGPNTASKESISMQRKGWVVDEYLRVRGVQKLRIADASVIPSIPSSPIAATCMCTGVAAGVFMTNSETFD